MADLLAALTDFCDQSLLDRLTEVEAESAFIRRAKNRLEQMTAEMRTSFNLPNFDLLMTSDDHVEDALKYFSRLVSDTAWYPVAVELDRSANPEEELKRWQDVGYLAHASPLLDGGQSGLLFARDGFLLLRVPPHQTGRYLRPFLKSQRVLRLHDPQKKLSRPLPRRSQWQPSMVESGNMVYHGALPADFDRNTAGEGIRVAVIDSGIDHMHPELAGKVVAFKDFTDEGRGDYCGHGSHCAGIIAAQNAGGHGVLGIAPGVELLDAKVLDEDGTGDTTSIAAAVRWAADNGARVISMSLGGGHQTDGRSLLTRVCENVAREQDVVIVIAAGNEGDAGMGTISIPGDTKSALTVGAIDKDGRLANFSSRGPTVDESATGSKPNLVAPGVDIVSVSSGQVRDGADYVAFQGTSMACPHVAGAAAALLAYAPNLSADKVRDLLQDNCTPMEGALHEVGEGILNVPNALANASGSGLFGWTASEGMSNTKQWGLSVVATAIAIWFFWPSGTADDIKTEQPSGTVPPIAEIAATPNPPSVAETPASMPTPETTPQDHGGPIAERRSERFAELSRPTRRADVCSTNPKCFCYWEKEGVIERRVREGETLNKWAEMFDVPREELAGWNGLKSTANIAAGDKLLLSTEALDVKTHRIRNGQAMGVIAVNGKLKQSQLQRHNCISNPDKIYIGQPLLLLKPLQDDAPVADASQDEGAG